MKKAVELFKEWTSGEISVDSNPENHVAFIERIQRDAIASAVPAGWVAVPREPTEAMYDAADKAMSDTNGLQGAWKAMIAASEKLQRTEGET